MRTSYLLQSGLLAPTLFVALMGGACIGDPDPGTPTPGETPDPNAREHCGEITTDEVWALADSPHTLTCDVEITSGSVTIEAGTEVLVDAGGTYLAVQGGDLIAEGTADAPIVFKPSGDHQWYGVRVEPNAGDVTLRYAAIVDAIQQPGTASYGFGPLVLIDSEALVDHLAIDGGSDCGLVMMGEGKLKDGSTDLSVTGMTGWPVCASAMAAGSVPAEGADLNGNGTDGVYVFFDNGTLSTSATWSDVGVPYVLAHRIDVRGTAASPAVLTIEAGVEVRPVSSSSIRLGRYDDHGSGGLIVNGTEENPVLFTGHDGVARGSWGGITSYTGVPLELHHVIFENAGGVNGAGLWMEGGYALVDHVAFTGSLGMGISLINDARFHADSTHLTVTDCAELGRVYGEAAGSVPEEGVDLDGNDTDYLSIEGKGGPTELEFTDTWGDIGVAYKIPGNFNLIGTASSPTILTLEPGVNVTFAANGYLGVGGNGAAGLMAVGTEEAPITFKGADSLSPGAWAALYFSGDTIAEDTLLEHVEVAYAGSDTFYRRQGSIIVDAAHITINDSWIHHSLCNGISVYEQGSVASSNVTYTDMGTGEDCEDNPIIE